MDDTRSNPPHSNEPVDLSHLPEGRMDEIRQIFHLLGIDKGDAYPGAYEFSKQLQKATKLQYDGVIFTTTDSTISPFKAG
jgi:hypothetical protein